METYVFGLCNLCYYKVKLSTVKVAGNVSLSKHPSPSFLLNINFTIKIDWNKTFITSHTISHFNKSNISHLKLTFLKKLILFCNSVQWWEQNKIHWKRQKLQYNSFISPSFSWFVGKPRIYILIHPFLMQNNPCSLW